MCRSSHPVRVTHAVIQVAEREAKLRDANLLLLHVGPADTAIHDLGTTLTAHLNADDAPDWKRRLGAIASGLEKRGVNVTPVLAKGSAANEIITTAESENVDIIILGTHGRGALYDLVTGSVCEGVLRRTKCPVLIVPRSEMATPPDNSEDDDSKAEELAADLEDLAQESGEFVPGEDE